MVDDRSKIVTEQRGDIRQKILNHLLEGNFDKHYDDKTRKYYMIILAESSPAGPNEEMCPFSFLKLTTEINALLHGSSDDSNNQEYTAIASTTYYKTIQQMHRLLTPDQQAEFIYSAIIKAAKEDILQDIRNTANKK